MAISIPSVLLQSPATISQKMVADRAVQSGFRRLFADDELRLNSSTDQAFYIPRITTRSQARAGQSFYSLVESPDVTLRYIQCATSLIQVRSRYNFENSEAYANWNIPLNALIKQANNDAAYMVAESLALFGTDGISGMLRTPGVESTVLVMPDASKIPAGSNIQPETLMMIELYTALRDAITGVISKTLSWGEGGRLSRKTRLTILTTQRMIGQMSQPGIPLWLSTAVSDAAGGSAVGSIISQLKLNYAAANVDLEFVPSGQLYGIGDNGEDATIVCMPELPRNVGDRRAEFNTNSVQSSLIINQTQSTAVQPYHSSALILRQGTSDNVEWTCTGTQRICAGVPIRPEATRVIYSPADILKDAG